MASKALSGSLLRNVSVRGYASACPAVAKKTVKLEKGVAENKAILAALDNGTPVTRVTIAFKAGSRYEPSSDLGLVHTLRSAAGLTTKKGTSFIISRNLQQLGACVTATSDRDFIYYTLEVTKKHFPEAAKFLNSLVSEQEFRPWELDDNVPRLKYDVASLPPQVRAVDLLHKAAFRRGLGNSMFISPRRIGDISSESLQCYVNTYMTLDRCAVTGVGLTMEQLIPVANGLRMNESSKAGEAGGSSFKTNELRKEMGGELTHVAIGVPGAKANSKEALALAVAAKALGNGPAVKWGEDNTALGRALCKLGPCAAAGFSAAYHDAGVFGALLTVPYEKAAEATAIVKGALKCATLTGEQITAGKNQLQVAILSQGDAYTAFSESLAAQALYGGVKSAAELADEVKALSNDAVLGAFSSAAKGGCMAMGAVGNLSNVPYLDEI